MIRQQITCNGCMYLSIIEVSVGGRQNETGSGVKRVHKDDDDGTGFSFVLDMMIRILLSHVRRWVNWMTDDYLFRFRWWGCTGCRVAWDVGLQPPPLDDPEVSETAVGLNGPTSSTSMSSSSEQSPATFSSQESMLLSSSDVISPLFPLDEDPVPAKASTLKQWREDDVVDVLPPLLSFLLDEWCPPCNIFWWWSCCCRSLLIIWIN